MKTTPTTQLSKNGQYKLNIAEPKEEQLDQAVEWIALLCLQNRVQKSICITNKNLTIKNNVFKSYQMLVMAKKSSSRLGISENCS